MIEWRIAAEHPSTTRLVTLYATPYENLARQEWRNTPKDGSAFTAHRLQRRRPGGEWEDVNDAA